MADGTIRLTEALLRLGKNLDLRFRIKLRNNVYFAPLSNDVARFFVCSFVFSFSHPSVCEEVPHMVLICIP